MMQRDERRVGLEAVAAWGLAVGAGLMALTVYEGTPEKVGPSIDRWPAGSRVPLSRDRPTLLMAVHPQCPCTRASGAELARILARHEGRVAAHVLIFSPSGPDPRWSPPAWSERLASMPGVRLVNDIGGTEAARFGARTSGMVVLFHPESRLLFRGGITGARGHEGDNAGKAAVSSLIAGDRRSPASAPVFGCPLY